MKKEDKTIRRGSEWRKWDLHLHSFYSSIKNSFGGSTEDEYVKRIKKSNIEVVGLSNYFNFNEHDWELKGKLESEGVLVFLNLELRLTYTNKEDDCCDIHIIFSNELNKTDVGTFLTKLNCSISGSQKTLNAVTDAEKNSAVVEFNKIMEVLADPAIITLKEKILIGMLSRGKGSSRSSKMYESLTKDANFIIHSTDKVKNIEDDIRYWSGKDEKKPLKRKALFQSSDAHDVEGIGKKYSWVKGDPCFETLRQAIVDYDNRILIQDRNPAENKNSSLELFIDRIEYEHEDKNHKLYFNKDINSVIGMRGAGKSVLLKHIVFDVLSKEAKEINKLKKFKVYWGDEISESKFVEYIPQNYLSTITYEDGDKYDERDQKLKELLFNNELFNNANTSKTDVINSIELKINSEIKNVLSLHRQIVEANIQIKPLGKSEDKEKAIKTKQGEIDKLGKINITDEDIKSQTTLSSEMEALVKEIKLYEQDIQIIENIHKSNKSSILSVDDEVFWGISRSTLELIEKHVEELTNQDIKTYLSSLLTDLRGKLKNNVERKNAVEKELAPINIKLQQNKTIEKILKEISKLDSDKKEIKRLHKFIGEGEKNKDESINDMVGYYLSFKEKIENIIKTLKSEFDNFTFVTFDFAVSYDIDTYKRRFFDIYVDGRSGERFKKYIDEKRDFNKKEIIEVIKDIVSDADTAKLKTAGANKESALISLLSCRYDIDFTKSVKYKEGKTSVDFENMTGGQKAMALLDLIFNLSKGVYPIIIDQPENDIDISGISNDLKKLILDQKERRQVIIATHSPNLLLLTDSENVIVAENNNNIIKYHNSGIEDKKIQDDIINILEGGKDALAKRMSKLNIANCNV